MHEEKSVTIQCMRGITDVRPKETFLFFVVLSPSKEIAVLYVCRECSLSPWKVHANCHALITYSLEKVSTGVAGRFLGIEY